MEVCVSAKKNLGTIRCNKLPQMPRLMITTPEDFFLTPEQYATPTALRTALQNALIDDLVGRIYLWPNFVGYENASEDAVYEETPLSDLEVRPGKYRFRFHIRKNLCMHKAMFTHNADGGRVFIIDVKGQLLGTEDENGNLYGFTMNMLNVEKLMFSDGTVASKTPVYVVLADPSELDLNGALIDAAGVVNTLKRLTDVVITQEALDDDEITVKVVTECDGVPIVGLVAADFKVLDSDGATKAITSPITDNGDGTYVIDLASTSFEDGDTVGLVDPADLSIQAYEAPEPLEVTVPSV